MHSTHMTGEMAARERRAQWLWTGGIIGFFAIQAVLWAIAITMTSNDPSHAVIEDYDTRAIGWDSYHAEIVASQKLGWVAAISLRPVENRAGEVTVQIDVRDATGAPVDDATVAVDMFHCGRAAEKFSVALSGQGAGGYVGSVRLAHPGKWQFDVRADRGEDHFFESQRHDLDRELLGQKKFRYADPRR